MVLMRIMGRCLGCLMADTSPLLGQLIQWLGRGRRRRCWGTLWLARTRSLTIVALRRGEHGRIVLVQSLLVRHCKRLSVLTRSARFRSRQMVQLTGSGSPNAASTLSMLSSPSPPHTWVDSVMDKLGCKPVCWCGWPWPLVCCITRVPSATPTCLTTPAPLCGVRFSGTTPELSDSVDEFDGMRPFGGRGRIDESGEHSKLNRL